MQYVKQVSPEFTNSASTTNHNLKTAMIPSHIEGIYTPKITPSTTEKVTPNDYLLKTATVPSQIYTPKIVPSRVGKPTSNSSNHGFKPATMSIGGSYTPRTACGVISKPSPNTHSHIGGMYAPTRITPNTTVKANPTIHGLKPTAVPTQINAPIIPPNTMNKTRNNIVPTSPSPFPLAESQARTYTPSAIKPSK